MNYKTLVAGFAVAALPFIAGCKNTERYAGTVTDTDSIKYQISIKRETVSDPKPRHYHRQIYADNDSLGIHMAVFDCGLSEGWDLAAVSTGFPDSSGTTVEIVQGLFKSDLLDRAVEKLENDGHRQRGIHLPTSGR